MTASCAENNVMMPKAEFEFLKFVKDLIFQLEKSLKTI